MAKTLLRIKGDPKKPESEALISPSKTPIDVNFDLRDRLAELVGSGNTLKPDDKAAIFSNLTSTLGRDKAEKIMTHAYLFNTRPEVQRLPLEDKLRAFYTIGSADPDVMEIMGRTKNLGYGVVQGARQSASNINQQIYGGVPMASSAQPTEDMARKKIMLRVSK